MYVNPLTSNQHLLKACFGHDEVCKPRARLSSPEAFLSAKGKLKRIPSWAGLFQEMGPWRIVEIQWPV
jgi:hypothetical protein